MRVYVDPDICQGHTLCAMAAPEIFSLGVHDGHAFVADEELTPDQRELAIRAASTCPEGAIRVVE